MRYDTLHKVLMVNTTSVPSRNFRRIDPVILIHIFLEMVLGQFTTYHGPYTSNVYIESCRPFHAPVNTYLSWLVEEEYH
jgi:hypothetical protein